MSMVLYTFLIHNFCLRRLKVYDRNFDFKPDLLILPQNVHEPTEWPLTGYQKLLEITNKAILPKMSGEQIEAYFIYILAGNTVVYYPRQIKRNPNHTYNIQISLHIYLFIVLH